MRAVAIAAAGAALAGTVAAVPSGWNDWSSSSEDPVKITSKTPEPEKSTTTPAAESSTEHTWADWTSSSSDPVKITSKTTTTTTEHTWEDWTSSTTKPVEIATTTSSDPVKDTTSSSSTEHTWEDWTTSSSTSKPVEITSTSSYDPTHTWADWESESSSPVEITSTTKPVEITSASSYDPTHTWADWESESSPVEITSTSEADPSTTWADWESVTSTVVKSGTTTTTIYLGKPTDPVELAETTPADLTATSTWADWTASSSSPAPAWSSDGWFGPGWDAPEGQCAFQVVTSYGSPVWSATPEASLPVLSVTVNPTAPAEETASSSTTWADWSATSSEPSLETTSKPAEESSYSTTWADWSATSSEPSLETTSYPSVESSSTPSEEGASSTTWADWSQPTGGLGGEDGKDTWGLTYSPYTSSGECKDADTVAKDLAVIAGKGFSTVRVYSTDCNTLENVGKSARDNGLKLILGVFIDKEGIEASKEQVWDIIYWAQWDLVELIIIGNEAVYNGWCSAADLAAYITESKDFFVKAGYTGPVSTTETLDEWKKDGATFCGVVDVVAANLYAFFNAEVTADKAGEFIQRQIDELEQVCPGKDTYVMESGWPSAGECNGKACPSKENQAVAIKSIEEVTGSKVIFFSYEDEAWKEAGEFGVEQYWGCADVF